MGEDFRQTLPIIRKGEKDDCISATLVMSDLWHSFERIKLKINMRAPLDPTAFILRIGNGKQPTFEDDRISLPSHILLPYIDDDISLDTLIDFVYPDLNFFFSNPELVTNRAILTTKNEFVDEISSLMIQRFPGREKRFLSINKTADTRQQGDYEDLLQNHNPRHIIMF